MPISGGLWEMGHELRRHVSGLMAFLRWRQHAFSESIFDNNGVRHVGAQ
jgi:hypothetical protein